MSNTPKYEMVSSYRRLKSIVKRCVKEGQTALDFETTSLTPDTGRVRLVSLCNTKVHALVDFDKIKGGFAKCAPLFNKGTWIVFYAPFEVRWFLAAGTSPVLYDLANLRRAILGGGTFKLMQLAEWDLDVEMSKEEQASDWSAKKLRQEQLDYAYFDADITWRLWQYWAEQADAGHWSGFHIINDMLHGVIEMEDAGMMLDKRRHRTLVKEWEEIQDQKIADLREMVPETEVANLNSGAQWSDYFARYMPDDVLKGWPRTAKTGQLRTKADDLRRFAGLYHGTLLERLFDTLADHKKIGKYLSSFGETLITKANLSRDGRIHPSFNIGAAKTVRFSSSNPNVQQIPRDTILLGEDTSVRASFKAGLGRKLVSLDYSGIELRVLALLSGDKQLLEDMVEGDVHLEVASTIAGEAVDKGTKKGKALRQAAKAVSFGIIYGIGAPGLGATMRVPMTTAQKYIDFWATRYPDAFQLRYDMMDEVAHTRYIRMVDGRTIYMGKTPDLPKCANYPVQSASLSVMARAITRHKITLDELRVIKRQRMTRMIATIHDALIDEAATKDAAECYKAMEYDMTNAYLDIFPGAPIERLVEGGVGPHWGQLD